MRKNTQCGRILEYLRTHEYITAADAFYKLRIARLAARISDLRERGYSIKSVDVQTTNEAGDRIRYARYILDKEVAP